MNRTNGQGNTVERTNAATTWRRRTRAITALAAGVALVGLTGACKQTCLDDGFAWQQKEDCGAASATDSAGTDTTTLTGASMSATMTATMSASESESASASATDSASASATATDTAATATDSATDTAATDSTTGGPACGNGQIDAGEVCDDGVNDGSYNGCMPGCMEIGPYCGDGMVFDGAELCDDGNDVDNDACSNACKGSFAGTFTPCGATLNLGPSQAMCDSAYANTKVSVTVNTGIQSWTVPFTATYRIELWGAEGGKHNFGVGGRGAHVRGDFNLTKGDVLKILVGQKGKDGTSYDVGAGGGTFVARADNTPLIVAGGGGAAGNCGGGWNLPQQDGKSIAGNGQGGDSSGDGQWCGCGGAGSAGGGFLTNGKNSGAKAFVNGGAGDSTERPGQCVDSGLGGFGGGGNGGNGGGGGGGYEGGNGGGVNGDGTYAYGKGGKSFNSGTNPIAEDGIRVGQGELKITKL